MSIDLLAKLARVAMELIERTTLRHTSFLWAALRRLLMFPQNTGGAYLGVAEDARQPVGVRRDAGSFSPERAVAAGVEADLRAERQGYRAAPQH